jgi:thioredoxin reductase
MRDEQKAQVLAQLMGWQCRPSRKAGRALGVPMRDQGRRRGRQLLIAGEHRPAEAAGLFLLIGGHPRTEWLPENVERDRAGYLLTGLDLVRGGKVVDCWPLERTPRMLETSMPGAFAIGDVRRGSLQRVAAAVGDGSLVVNQIHRLLDSPDRGALA